MESLLLHRRGVLNQSFDTLGLQFRGTVLTSLVLFPLFSAGISVSLVLVSIEAVIPWNGVKMKSTRCVDCLTYSCRSGLPVFFFTYKHTYNLYAFALLISQTLVLASQKLQARFQHINKYKSSSSKMPAKLSALGKLRRKVAAKRVVQGPRFAPNTGLEKLEATGKANIIQPVRSAFFDHLSSAPVSQAEYGVNSTESEVCNQPQATILVDINGAPKIVKFNHQRTAIANNSQAVPIIERQKTEPEGDLNAAPPSKLSKFKKARSEVNEIAACQPLINEKRALTSDERRKKEREQHRRRLAARRRYEEEKKRLAAIKALAEITPIKHLQALGTITDMPTPTFAGVFHFGTLIEQNQDAEKASSCGDSGYGGEASP
jgi:hypothetical protein